MGVSLPRAAHEFGSVVDPQLQDKELLRYARVKDLKRNGKNGRKVYSFEILEKIEDMSISFPKKNLKSLETSRQFKRKTLYFNDASNKRGSMLYINLKRFTTCTETWTSKK